MYAWGRLQKNAVAAVYRTVWHRYSQWPRYKCTKEEEKEDHHQEKEVDQQVLDVYVTKTRE
jgi:hypothetical protein